MQTKRYCIEKKLEDENEKAVGEINIYVASVAFVKFLKKHAMKMCQSGMTANQWAAQFCPFLTLM